MWTVIYVSFFIGTVFGLFIAGLLASARCNDCAMRNDVKDNERTTP